MTAKRLKAGSKKAGVLQTLLDRGQRGLNRFEAERECADHVLPSTISELKSGYGLTIPRKLETVRGHLGHPTECSRYWLSDDDQAKARELLSPADAARSDPEAAGAAQRRWEVAMEQERRDRAQRPHGGPA